MSEQRLDPNEIVWYSERDGIRLSKKTYGEIFDEIVRAQASEDAKDAEIAMAQTAMRGAMQLATEVEAERDTLRERVRVLEEFLQKPIVVLPIALDIGDDGTVAEIFRKIIEDELNKYAKKALGGGKGEG